MRNDRDCRDCTAEPLTYPFFAALNFAHRAFVAFAIFALPAADNTRFFTPVICLFVESPKAFAAARTPLNCCCTLPNCFSSFLSSRLIAARMSMNPPEEIYLKAELGTRRTARGK